MVVPEAVVDVRNYICKKRSEEYFDNEDGFAISSTVLLTFDLGMRGYRKM